MLTLKEAFAIKKLNLKFIKLLKEQTEDDIKKVEKQIYDTVKKDGAQRFIKLTNNLKRIFDKEFLINTFNSNEEILKQIQKYYQNNDSINFLDSVMMHIISTNTLYNAVSELFTSLSAETDKVEEVTNDAKEELIRSLNSVNLSDIKNNEIKALLKKEDAARLDTIFTKFLGRTKGKDIKNKKGIFNAFITDSQANKKANENVLNLIKQISSKDTDKSGTDVTKLSPEGESLKKAIVSNPDIQNAPSPKAKIDTLIGKLANAGVKPTIFAKK